MSEPGFAGFLDFQDADPNDPVLIAGDPSNVEAANQTGYNDAMAEKYDFETCPPSATDILQDTAINTVFVATRHDSHACYVLDALKSKKHIFVEKPICLIPDELLEIKKCYQGDRHLMVGFNRRFSPLSQILKKKLGTSPYAMTYRINAGAIPADNWIQDMAIGGGRIIGEVCHFIDYLAFMCGSLPKTIFATAMQSPHNLNDTLTIAVTFADGSIGSINYFANGSKELPKEQIEIFSNGASAVLRDFKELEIFGKGKSTKEKLLNQDKGQKNMVQAFIQSIQNGTPTPISSAEIFGVMDATFAVIESIKTQSVIQLGTSC